MKKKLLLRLMSVLFCFSLIGFVACKSGGATSTPQWQVDGLELNYSSKDIVVYETFELKANATGKVEYVVQNGEIVTVSKDGIVKGKSEGTTYVAVYAGSDVAFCKVTVSESDLQPEVTVEQTQVSLNKNTEFDLNPKLYYNGNEQKTTFTLESSDTQVLEIRDGKLFAKSLGEAVVTVSTRFETFDTQLTTKTVNVSVVPDVNVIVNNDDLSLSKVDSAMGEEFENTLTLDVEVWIDGEKTSATPTLVNKTQDVVSLSGTTVTAIKEGSGEIEVVYLHSEGGKDYEVKTTANIEVYKPIIERENLVYVDGWIDGDIKRGISEIALDPVEFFGFDETITQVVDVTSIEKSYDVTNNAISSSIVLGDRRWRVYAENYGVEVDVKSVSMIINTAEDLRVFSLLLENNQAKGYYCLGADINYRGERFGANVQNTNDYFNGVLDGRNHTISNINVVEGFIRNFGSDGVIKNLALLDAFTNNSTAGALSFFAKGTIENVYVDFTAEAVSKMGGIAFRLYEGSKIVNTIIDFKSPFAPAIDITGRTGLYGYDVEGATLKNVFIAADPTRFVNKSGSGQDSKYDEENVAICESITSFTAEQRATNSFASVGEVKISYSVDPLDGNAYLTSNAPVTYSGADVDKSTVAAKDPTDKATYGVTAKSIFDDRVSSTLDVTTGGELQTLSTGYAIKVDGKSEYEVNVDDVLSVDDIKKYVFFNDRLNFRYDVKLGEGNSLKISADLLVDGDNTLYAIDGDGKAYKIPFGLYVPISSADDLIAALGKHKNEANVGSYILTCDIDMQGKEWQYNNFFADLFGNGHAIKNISTNNFLFNRYKGKMSNVRFENVRLTASDGANFQSLIKEIFGGSVFENVYSDITFDGGTFFSAIGDANNAEKDTEITLTDVVGRLNIVNGVAAHNPSLIRKIQATSSKTTVVMTNCYLVQTSAVTQNKQAALIAVINKGSGQVSATIANDGEDTYTNNGDAGFGSQYCYLTMSEVYAYNKAKFVDAMWDDIIKHDENEFVSAGYKVLASNKDLSTLVERLKTEDVRDNYILSADIDATGIVANSTSGVFRGEINGLGHSISNLTVECCLIKTMTGKISNLAFVNTSFKNTSVNALGLFNEVVGATLKNVYVDMSITASSSVFVSPFGGSVKGISLTNAVAKIGFTEENSATPSAIGAIWMANATDRNATVDMNNVYLIEGDNFGSNNSTGLVNWLRSGLSYTANVKVVNGIDSAYVQDNATGADMRDGYAKGYIFGSYEALTSARKDYEKALTNKVFDKLKEKE